MDTNVGATRAYALAFRAWNSSGATFNTRVTNAINIALMKLASDLPEAFVPDTETIPLFAPVDSQSSTVNVLFQATADRWVLRITDSSGADLGTSALTTWRPVTNGAWDGRMHLEIPFPGATDGSEGRRQSREWWSVVSVGAGTEEYYVSLDRRWRNTTDANMTGRIYAKEFYTRSDVMRLLEPGRIWNDDRSMVWKVDTAGAFRQGQVDYQRETTDAPYRMFRTRHFQLPGPTAIPTVTTGGPAPPGGVIPNPWLGPVQEGDFTFCYTYAWGNRGTEWQEGEDGGISDPLFESAPSPVTASFSHTANAGQSIILQGTNIDAMRNFDVAGVLREGHSGLKLRWYVARSAVRTAGAGQAAYNRVETDSRFYFLGECEPTASVGGAFGTPSYEWTGAVIPDYSRPLVKSTGYYAWEVWPHQDANYEMDLRVLRRPREMVTDRDVVPIQLDAYPCFLELVIHYLCRMDGVDQTSAAVHLENYRNMAATVRSTYANPGGVVEPMPLGGYYQPNRFGTYTEEP